MEIHLVSNANASKVTRVRLRAVHETRLLFTMNGSFRGSSCKHEEEKCLTTTVVIPRVVSSGTETSRYARYDTRFFFY